MMAMLNTCKILFSKTHHALEHQNASCSCQNHFFYPLLTPLRQLQTSPNGMLYGPIALEPQSDTNLLDLFLFLCIALLFICSCVCVLLFHLSVCVSVYLSVHVHADSDSAVVGGCPSSLHRQRAGQRVRLCPRLRT